MLNYGKVRPRRMVYVSTPTANSGGHNPFYSKIRLYSPLFSTEPVSTLSASYINGVMEN